MYRVLIITRTVWIVHEFYRQAKLVLFVDYLVIIVDFIFRYIFVEKYLTG